MADRHSSQRVGRSHPFLSGGRGFLAAGWAALRSVSALAIGGYNRVEAALLELIDFIFCGHTVAVSADLDFVDCSASAINRLDHRDVTAVLKRRLRKYERCASFRRTSLPNWATW